MAASKTNPTSIRRPEWAGEGEGFASGVMGGVRGGHDGMAGGPPRPRFARRRPSFTERELLDGVLACDRTVLGRVITLIESNAEHHFDLAQRLLQSLLPHAGNSIRIGITGVPGAGKSTFIDAFGSLLTSKGHRVAVLAVDPSSTMTRGSILGDKTRMEALSRDPKAFIRPSPSGGTLGGVSRKTRETVLACEAAGFDVILVETVGVGQSEAAVRSMTDFFLLLALTGAGDELQGIKRGVMENADALLVHKADGDNLAAARRQCSEMTHALHYLRSPTPDWTPKAFMASSREKTGLEELWQVILRFKEITGQSGFFAQRRNEQTIDWMMAMVLEQVQSRFLAQGAVRARLPRLRQDVSQGRRTATAAARELLDLFESAPSPVSPAKGS